MGKRLVLKDWFSLFRWISVAVIFTALFIISVVFQDVEWAEKVEKALNLLFIATVATIIGVASVQPDRNWLYDLSSGRRQIFTATDIDERGFADVLEFLERAEEPGRFVSTEQASWVSNNNHGTTQIGRPVRLSELLSSKLSISSKFELCISKNIPGKVPRSIELTHSGISFVSGPIGAPIDYSLGISLESRLLVGGQ